MQDNNLRIAFDYKYPDSPALMAYEAFGASIFAEGSIRVRKTIVGGKAVELYSQLTGKSIPEIHKEAGNINWAAYGSALAENQLKFKTNDKSNGSEIKLTNSKNLSRMVSEAEELSRKILGKEKTNGTKL